VDRIKKLKSGQGPTKGCRAIGRQTNMQIGRQAGRQTDRQTGHAGRTNRQDRQDRQAGTRMDGWMDGWMDR
jgi:hypothetical protein